MKCAKLLVCLVALGMLPNGLNAQVYKDHTEIEKELLPAPARKQSGGLLLRGAGPRPTPAPAGKAATNDPTPSEDAGAIGASDLTVQFVSGSGTLTPEGIAQLRELASALTSPRLSGYRFRVEGYTDTVGSVAYNQQLSEVRAASAVSYLTHEGNIQPNRLEAHGFGKTKLAVPTPDNTPEPRNRRVRIVTIGR